MMLRIVMMKIQMLCCKLQQSIFMMNTVISLQEIRKCTAFSAGDTQVAPTMLTMVMLQMPSPLGKVAKRSLVG